MPANPATTHARHPMPPARARPSPQAQNIGMTTAPYRVNDVKPPLMAGRTPNTNAHKAHPRLRLHIHGIV